MNVYETFIEYLNDSQYTAFFGGAGVSTESGVPDFRSKDGLYNQQDIRFEMYRPEYLLSHTCLVNEPKVYYEFHRQKMDTRSIEPNNAHKYLAKLEEMGKLQGIITQNIDGLHQKAASNNVYEIHGSALRNYCPRCKKNYKEDHIFNTKEPIPYCECGGIVRPDITLYEESLPEVAVDKAVKCISNAEMLIIGGTSLTVYPAASYINYFSGKHLVIINRDSLNVKFKSNTLTVHENIGEFFTRVAQIQGIEL